MSGPKCPWPKCLWAQLSWIPLALPKVMQALHVASSACSFLLYHELSSDRELFTNHELPEARTSPLGTHKQTKSVGLVVYY